MKDYLCSRKVGLNMKKMLFLLGITCLSTSLLAKEWYEEKGTLHQATMKEWCKADEKNKLATAGDFVSKGYVDKVFKPEIIQAIQEHKMDGIKFMAGEVVAALDTAACEDKKASKELATSEVSSLAATSMILMGWIDKKE